MKRSLTILMLSALVFALFSVSLFTGEEEVKILVTPAKALYATPFSLKVTGLNPGEKVSLTASSIDKKGKKWISNNDFTADEKGAIHLNENTPVNGNLEKKNPLRLLWLMKVAGAQKKHTYSYDREKGFSIIFSVTNSKGNVSTAELTRYYEDPDRELLRLTLDENGLKGFLYSPGTGGKYPGIILLGGSNGGTNPFLAKSIASHGFSVLDLPYFRYPGLPEKLINIPLEYFEKATKWMNNQKSVKTGKIGLIGGSRGGELVLLLGERFDYYNAVVAWVPAAHAWVGEEFTKRVPAWSFRGKELPYLGSAFTKEELDDFYAGKITSFRGYFENDLKKTDPKIIERCAIKVEKIKAPLLFVSGTDDQTWPSTEFTEMMIKRLKKNNFKYDVEHIKGQDAGHMVFMPDFIPGDFRFFNGGTPKAELYWSVKSWQAMISFLHKYLDN